MQENRKMRTLRNLIYAWLNQSFTMIMNMVVRIILVRTLTKEYVGIGGLFGNVITMLSLAELGIGSAIVYSLYKPLADNDQRKIKALMKFYQQVYVCMGCIIAIVGVTLTPFLSWFMKEMPDIPHLSFIYILFVLNAACSYFYSYKGSLISTDQKDYILKQIRVKVMLVMYLTQIIVLLIWKSYIIYLIIQVICTFIMNLLFSKEADKLYPYLKGTTKEQLDRISLDEILKNTKALICHKIGSIVVFSTDNVIISKFTGLANVANYSNYTMIQETLNGILAQVFVAMAASVGNLATVEDEKKNLLVFKRIMFLNACLYGYCSICFWCLAQDFVKMCFGTSYLVSEKLLAVIVLNFYINGLRKCTMVFKDAYGIFFQNWYSPLFEALVNLTVSLLLVQWIGVIGVLIGTTISSLAAPVWSEPYVVFRYGFHRNVMEYWKDYLTYMGIVILAGVISWRIILLVPYIPIVSFITKGIICTIITLFTFTVLLWKNRSMQYYIELLKTLKNN